MNKKSNKQLLNPNIANISIVNKSTRDANKKFILRQIQRGFRPKWYCVFHLNSASRAKDEILLDKDLIHIKNVLYSELYGRKWKGLKRRARAVWSVEFGKDGNRPHINLLIESLPYPYDSYRSAFILFDRILPRDGMSVWRKSANLQPIDLDDAEDLYKYVVKESDWSNTSIHYTTTDYIP